MASRRSTRKSIYDVQTDLVASRRNIGNRFTDLQKKEGDLQSDLQLVNRHFASHMASRRNIANRFTIYKKFWKFL